MITPGVGFLHKERERDIRRKSGHSCAILLFILGQIVVHHDDDVRVWDAILVQDLVGVADVRLMSVVVPAVGARNEHSPVLASCSRVSDDAEQRNTSDE